MKVPQKFKRFRKIALHNKIINKTRSTKNQENSAHVLETIICKVGLNPEEYALVITFLKENR